MAILIGEFELDPELIEETPLPPKGENILFEITSAKRGVAPTSGNAYISMELKFVENPAQKLFHTYFLSSKALAARSSGFSWKKFLDKMNLPYTTTAADLAGLRFVAVLRHKGAGDEAEAVIDRIIERA